MIRYTADARIDILDISQYTVDRWGETQANLYLAEFSQCFERVEKMPGLGPACFDIHPGLHRIEQGQHVIFYLPVPGGIFICRVLHRRMLVEYEDFLSSFSESIE